MTEDEAKTKWCPFYRLPAGGRLGFESGAVSADKAAYCIGSACMAWRVIAGESYKVGDRVSSRAVPDAGVERWKKSGWQVDDSGEAIEGYTAMIVFATEDSPPLGGFCGLAGPL